MHVSIAGKLASHSLRAEEHWAWAPGNKQATIVSRNKRSKTGIARTLLHTEILRVMPTGLFIRFIDT